MVLHEKGPSPARRGAEWMAAAVMAAVLLVGGCATPFQRARLTEDTNCAERRLEAANISYEDAKTQFAEHFQLRSDTSLRFAYYASQDSVRLARSIRSCFDFNFEYRVQAIELIRSNRILRRLVTQNMRDPDAQVAIDIFGNEYREIYKNDIH